MTLPYQQPGPWDLGGLKAPQGSWMETLPESRVSVGPDLLFLFRSFSLARDSPLRAGSSLSASTSCIFRSNQKAATQGPSCFLLSRKFSGIVCK